MEERGFPCVGVTRREFLQGTIAAAAANAVPGAGAATVAMSAQRPATGAFPTHPIHLTVNGVERTFDLDARVTLLDALRETAGLTGTKKGCDRGQCGACTVLVEGRRINACLTLAVMHEGQSIVTIEGLASGDTLSPLQQAFLDRDAFQCGFCTPGQLCSATALIEEFRSGAPSAATADVRSGKVEVNDDEVRERMSGNLCRCGAYPNIVRAIRDVADATAPPAGRSGAG